MWRLETCIAFSSFVSSVSVWCLQCGRQRCHSEEEGVRNSGLWREGSEALSDGEERRVLMSCHWWACCGPEVVSAISWNPNHHCGPNGLCGGLDCVLPKRCIGTIISKTSEWDPLRESVLDRSDQLKMSSSGWSPILYDWSPYKKRRLDIETNTYIQKEDGMKRCGEKTVLYK